MRPGTPRISIVLSFYNEAAVIPELLKRLRQVLAPLADQKQIASYELVFVNDASTDASETILRGELGNKDIVLVNMSRNFGVAECIMAGMEQASGDAVIYMDADLQDPPEIIPEMIHAWQNDPDAEVVYTTRLRRDGEHPLKMLVTKLGYRFIRSISEIKMPLDSGDFKLLSRRIVDHLLTLEEDKPFIRGMVSWIGFKQIPVYYNREARFDGRENTKFPVLSRRVIYSWLDRALISYSDEPLKLTLICGLALSVVSLLYIFVVLFQKIMGWYSPGWPALMCAILFIGGIQLMMLGFTGLYVGAIFRQSRRRPLYIIKEVLRAPQNAAG
jgi:polyisoprenyl-phosphate glycosyltransferase